MPVDVQWPGLPASLSLCAWFPVQKPHKGNGANSSPNSSAKIIFGSQKRVFPKAENPLSLDYCTYFIKPLSEKNECEDEVLLLQYNYFLLKTI